MNDQNTPHTPHAGFQGARIHGASLERPGVGLGSVETTFTDVDPEVVAIITGEPAVDLDALEALARAASPGLWEADEDGDEIVLNKGTALTRWNEAHTVGYPARSYLTADRLIAFDVDEEADLTSVVADVEYIAAARPEVLLALIERLRRAEVPTDRPTITIDLETGEWVEPAPVITERQGARVAASVLPGMTADQVAAAYSRWMSDDPVGEYEFCPAWRRIDWRSCILPPHQDGNHVFSRTDGVCRAEDAL